MLVSFSGIDSAGKTTQIDLLFKHCEDHNIRVQKVWSKARGTPGVVFLKELVRQDKKMSAEEKREHRKEVFGNPKKEKLLYIASMLDLCWYWGIYYRILSLGSRVVICDRYLWDTYVELNHDFAGINIDRSLLWKIVRRVAAKPKVSFVFVIPAEVSLERDRQKNAAGIDELESKQAKIATYLKCVEEGRWSNVMDGMKSIHDLHEEVLSILHMG